MDHFILIDGTGILKGSKWRCISKTFLLWHSGMLKGTQYDIANRIPDALMIACIVIINARITVPMFSGYFFVLFLLQIFLFIHTCLVCLFLYILLYFSMLKFSYLLVKKHSSPLIRCKQSRPTTVSHTQLLVSLSACRHLL